MHFSAFNAFLTLSGVLFLRCSPLQSEPRPNAMSPMENIVGASPEEFVFLRLLKKFSAMQPEDHFVRYLSFGMSRRCVNAIGDGKFYLNTSIVR